MSARRRIGDRKLWTVLAWLLLAALTAAAIALDDVSLAIGAGVAGAWALCVGFFPVATVDRPKR